MSTILKYVFGAAASKKITSTSIGSKIVDLKAQIDAEQARQARASATLASPATLTDEQHAAAEAELASARRAVTRHKAAIEALEVEQDAALETETRDALVREIDRVRKRAEAAQRLIEAEYVKRASALAELLGEVAATRSETASVRRQAHALGLAVEIADPEDFRHGADQYAAEWPSKQPSAPGRMVSNETTVVMHGNNARVILPEDNEENLGPTISGSAADAPAWAVEWIDGHPQPAIDHPCIRVTRRPRRHASDLVSSIGDLPGLMHGDPAIFSAQV